MGDAMIFTCMTDYEKLYIGKKSHLKLGDVHGFIREIKTADLFLILRISVRS